MALEMAHLSGASMPPSTTGARRPLMCSCYCLRASISLEVLHFLRVGIFASAFSLSVAFSSSVFLIDLDCAIPVAVWTNVSMCTGEGPRYPCGGEQQDLYSCLAAGCCYDDASPSAPCFQYPFADEPLQVRWLQAYARFFYHVGRQP